MDRTLISPLEQMRDFDYVQGQHDILVAMANQDADTLGQTLTVIGGLVATASNPASLTVLISSGRIHQLAPADATAAGSIPADSTIIYQSGNAAAQSVTLSTAGLSSGQSRWALIQASFSQADSVRVNDPTGGSVVFYNSANPTQPNVQSINTVRQGLCSVQVVYGAPATTGSETPPTPSVGWVPLYLVDVTFGQSTVVQSQIIQAGPSVGTGVPSNYPYAPFLAGLLNSHHGGVPGQAPKIKLASEVQGTLPLVNLPPIRQQLTANLNLYVATTGNNGNSGLTAGTPLLTLQAAWTKLFSYDLNGFSVTVNIANGTYFGPSCNGIPPGAGGDSVSFVGNVASPSSVIIQGTNANAFTATNGAQISASGVELQASGAFNSLTGICLFASVNAGISFSNVIFGSATAHCYAANNASIFASGPYTIGGSAQYHVYANANSVIGIATETVTLTGTPAFTTFATAAECGIVSAYSMTFSGSATGQYYNALLNGVINTNVGGATYFPGSTSGSTSLGGQYN